MPRIHPENVAAAFPGGPAAGRLPPLTLLAVLALRAMKSPVMTTAQDGRPAACTLDDLLLAVGIMKADPAMLAGLVSRATRDTTCEQLGIPLGDADRQDMVAARIELRELALAVASEVGVEAVEDLGRDLQGQIDHAFATLVPMVDPEKPSSPLAGRPAPA